MYDEDDYDTDDPANWDFEGKGFNIFRHEYLQYTGRA